MPQTLHQVPPGTPELGGTTRGQAGKSGNMPLATTFPVFFFLFQTQLIPVSMHKNLFQSHTVGSCEMHPGSPICASRLVIHWQVPDLAADNSCDFEDHALCGKNIPQNYKRNSKGCKINGFVEALRSPQLRAALPWEATVLPTGGTGTFQGKHHCPKALELWLCGQTP